MKLQEIIQKIEQNQALIQSYGQFEMSILKKINYKLRLDWNYYSNRMEGGTLTKAETRSVMVGNIDVHGKPYKDVAEMKGHDDVVLDVLKMSKGELTLSEKRIKSIHKSIMFEESDEKRAQIGEWKKTNNEIINYKNEKFGFVDWTDVPDKIHLLIDKTNAELEKYQKSKSTKHVLEIAGQFHIDLITIHPFYDGNGRTTRILTNTILLACGYPAIIIKEEYKKVYYQLLADIQVYSGNPDLFYIFLGERILDTQRIVLDALEGKDIEDPEDLDKKINLLEKELSVLDPNEEVKMHLTKDYVNDFLNTWGGDLIKHAIPQIQKFNKFFTGINHHVSLYNGGGYKKFIDETAENILSELQIQFDSTDIQFYENNPQGLHINTHYGTLIKGGLKTFGCNYGIEIKFKHIKYEVYVDEFIEESNTKNQVKLYERLLHMPLTETEIIKVVQLLTTAIYEHIDFYTKKNGLR